MARKSSRVLPQELFLSHSSRNRRFADKLANVLRRHGIPVWYSVTDIVGSQQWHDEIGSALERCDWFLIVLSKSAVKSRWVKRELMYVLDDPRFDGRIIPVLYRRCEPKQLSWTLPALQFVDFTGSFSDGCRDLLRTWGVGYKNDLE